jgi:hypothetical protein
LAITDVKRRLIGHRVSEEVQVNPGGSHASRNYMWACAVLP